MHHHLPFVIRFFFSFWTSLNFSLFFQCCRYRSLPTTSRQVSLFDIWPFLFIFTNIFHLGFPVFCALPMSGMPLKLSYGLFDAEIRLFSCLNTFTTFGYLSSKLQATTHFMLTNKSDNTLCTSFRILPARVYDYVVDFFDTGLEPHDE